MPDCSPVSMLQLGDSEQILKFSLVPMYKMQKEQHPLCSIILQIDKHACKVSSTGFCNSHIAIAFLTCMFSTCLLNCIFQSYNFHTVNSIKFSVRKVTYRRAHRHPVLFSVITLQTLQLLALPFALGLSVAILHGYMTTSLAFSINTAY